MTKFFLYFFTGDDPDFAQTICSMSRTVDDKNDFVKEGEFETFPEALDRMNNIGSRWFFFANACIIKDDLAKGGEREIVGIYMQDGFNVIAKEFVSMH